MENPVPGMADQKVTIPIETLIRPDYLKPELNWTCPENGVITLQAGPMPPGVMSGDMVFVTCSVHGDGNQSRGND